MVDKRQIHVMFPVGRVVVCRDIGPRPVLLASARFLSNLDGSMPIVAANSTAESYIPHLGVISLLCSCRVTTCDSSTAVYFCSRLDNGTHYVNVSVLMKFSKKTSVFTFIIISSP